MLGPGSKATSPRNYAFGMKPHEGNDRRGHGAPCDEKGTHMKATTDAGMEPLVTRRELT
jgi:hypothetical protein